VLIELSDNARRAVVAIQVRQQTDVDIADHIQFMRDSGLTFLECMKVVVTLTECTIGEAKRIVHESPAWVDEKFEREAVTDRLIDDAEVAFGADGIRK
jgi:ribosomal protein L7/L12